MITKKKKGKLPRSGSEKHQQANGKKQRASNKGKRVGTCAKSDRFADNLH